MGNLRRSIPPHRWLLGGILALALFLRLYRLGSVPVGISGDEIFNAIDAAQIRWGNWPIFFPGNMGRESLFFYLLAPALSLLGRTVFALRLPAALLGAGSVLLGYLLGRDLFQRRVGLLAAGLTAVSLWSLMQSRWGLRAVSLTFCTGLTLYLLHRAVQHGRWRDWLLGGLAAGLTLYTYLPARLFPLVILFWLGWLGWEQRGRIQAQWRAIFVSLLIAVAIFAPFGWYMVQYPDLVNQRVYSMTAAYRTALQGDFAPLWASVRATLGAFSFQGDPDWRYNLSGKPVFDPLTSLFFYLGAALSLRYALRKGGDGQQGAASAYALLWLWAGAMLAPNALLDENPSFLRAAGAVLPVYLLTAIGLEATYRWLCNRWALWRKRPYIPLALVMMGLSFILADTWHSYFTIWHNHPRVREIYHGDVAMIGRYLAETPPSEARVFIVDPYAYDTGPRALAFHTTAKTSWFVPVNSVVYPQSGPVWYLAPLDAPLPWLPLEERLTMPYPNGDPAFYLYQLAAPPPQPPDHLLGVDFTNGPTLVGYQLPAAIYRGDTVPILMAWQIPPGLPPLPTAYAFAQISLLDEDGRVWHQGSSLFPYPQHSWQPGDLIWQEVPLEIPAGLPPGFMRLRFDLVDNAGQPYAAGGVADSVSFLTNGRPLINYVPAPETAVFANTIALQNAQLSTLIEPGLGTDIALDWIPLQVPPTDYLVEFQLLQPGNPTPILRQAAAILPDQYPPSRWVALEPVRSRHRLQIPADLPTTTAELILKLALLTPTGETVPLSQGSGEVTRLTLVTRERLFDLPAISQPTAAQFGSAVRLLGYDLPRSMAAAGEELALTLYWQALERPAQNYTVFTHLVGQDGQLYGQWDSLPSGAARLTSSWLPEEIVIDVRRLPIFAHAPAGEYDIVVGLYTDDGRLPVTGHGAAQPNDQFVLARVVVNP